MTDTSEKNEEPLFAEVRSRSIRDLSAALFVVSMFVLGAALLVLGIDVWLVVFAGILFGILLHTVASWIASKTPLSGKAAVIIVTIALLVLVVGVGWLIMPQLAKQTDKLVETLPRSINQMVESISRYRWGQMLIEKVPKAGSAIAKQQNVAAQVTSFFASLAVGIGNIVAILFLGVFFAATPRLYTNGVVALVPRKHESRAREVLHDLRMTLSRWLLGQLCTMAIVGVLYTVGLSLLGVEMALALGLFAALLAFVPTIGPIVASVPAILVGFLESPAQATYIAILYIVVETIEGNVLTPLIQKRMVYLPPALQLAAQFLMGAVIGVFALALATPMLAAVVVLVKLLYVEGFLGKPISVPGDNSNNHNGKQKQATDTSAG